MRGYRLWWVLPLLSACVAPPPLPANDSAPVANVAVSPVTAGMAEAARERESESRFMATVDLDNSVFFGLGQSEISAQGLALLRQHAQHLRANDKLALTIIGHTDHLGSPAYNIAIADRRVDAVYRYLVKQGVARQQLRRFGAGAEMNPAHCHSASCRRLLRRVELKYDENESAR